MPALLSAPTPPATVARTLAVALPDSDIDAGLVAQVLAGRTEAFAPLLARYQRQARAIAGRILKADHAGLEDVLAEAACRAFANLHLLREGSRFRSWYCTIVRNAALDYAMRQQRERGPSAVEENEETPGDWWASLPATGPGPEDLMEAEGDRRAVRKALASLEPLYRDPVVARFLHDRSYEEIARDLNKPIGTVKSLVHRGTRRMAESLKLASVAC